MLRRFLILGATSLAPLGFYGCEETGPTSTIVGVTVVQGDLLLTSQSDVDYLAGLREIKGNLMIRGNSTADPIIDLQPLSGLRGLQKVTAIGYGGLVIKGNTALDNCVATDFAAAIPIDGEVEIHGNGPCQ